MYKYLINCDVCYVECEFYFVIFFIVQGIIYLVIFFLFLM